MVQRGPTKRKSYSPEFKAKVAIEAAKGTMTANELASKYEVDFWVERVMVTQG
jgi:hypothetical protein